MRVARRPSLVPLVAVLALIVPQRASAIKLFVDSVECMSKRVDFEGDAVTGSFVGAAECSVRCHQTLYNFLKFYTSYF